MKDELRDIAKKVPSRRGFIGKLSSRVFAITAAVFSGAQKGMSQNGCSLCYPPGDVSCCQFCTGGYGLWCWAGEAATDCCECVGEGYPCPGCDGVICSCMIVR